MRGTARLAVGTPSGIVPRLPTDENKKGDGKKERPSTLFSLAALVRPTFTYKTETIRGRAVNCAGPRDQAECLNEPRHVVGVETDTEEHFAGAVISAVLLLGCSPAPRRIARAI